MRLWARLKIFENLRTLMYIVVEGVGVRQWVLGFFLLMERLSEIKICEGNLRMAISILKIRNFMTDKNKF